MKTQLKALKKINIAYTLQVFAVILLLGYTVSSPVNKTKEIINNETLRLQANTQLLAQDSLLTEKTNTLKRYIVKRW